MLNRILVGLLGIPVLMFIYYSGGPYLLVFTNVIVGIGIYEFYKMAENIGVTPYKKLGIGIGLLIPNAIYFSDVSSAGNTLVLLLLLLLISCLGIRVFNNKVENSTSDIGATILGVIYVSLMFSHILLIAKLENGWKWVVAIQIMVWICDSAAYFVGMNIGRKFFKEGFSIISPKKSKEGALGGIIFTMLGIFLLNLKLDIHENICFILSLGFLISLVGQIGDLAESLFKREFKIKDSGRILGEHGGILDRFDSMIFVIPTVYYILKFI